MECSTLKKTDLSSTQSKSVLLQLLLWFTGRRIPSLSHMVWREGERGREGGERECVCVRIRIGK